MHADQPLLMNTRLGRSARVILAILAGLLAASCGAAMREESSDASDVVIDFKGFAPYVGDTLYLKVADQDPVTVATAEVVATPRQITRSEFRMTVPDSIEPGRMYNIDLWIDTDGNGTLDAGPGGTPAGVDLSWRIERTGIAGNNYLIFTPNDDWTDITPF